MTGEVRDKIGQIRNDFLVQRLTDTHAPNPGADIAKLNESNLMRSRLVRKSIRQEVGRARNAAVIDHRPVYSRVPSVMRQAPTRFPA